MRILVSFYGWWVETCRKLRDNLSVLAENFGKCRFNPLQNRSLFSLLPVVLCIASAFCYRAVYQTSDDMEMRFVLDGTLAGGYLEKPSEFTLYMSVLYGKFLKFFYTLAPEMYWYDLFTYLFLSVSIFVITLSCCQNFEQMSLFKKICILAVIPLVGATAFISPQFTITSGVLAISGVLAFYMLAVGFFKHKRQKVFCVLYFISSLFFSSIIRFECCMCVAFFMGVILLPLWPYHDWKGLMRKSFIVVFTLLLIILGVAADRWLVRQNPEWYDLRQSNIARVEIADKTEMWDNIFQPWKGAEDKVDLLSQDGYVFSKGDYRLLLTYLPFGNVNVFNLENLRKVSEELAPKVQEVNSILSGFRIKDFRGVFPAFCVVALLLAVFFSENRKKSFFVIFSFVAFVIILNCFYRALPYRLWFVLAFSTIIGLLLLLKNEKTDNRFLKYFSIIFIGFLTYYAHQIMYRQAMSTRHQYQVFSHLKQGMKFLPQDGIYMTNYSFGEHSAVPFHENIFFSNKKYVYGWLNMSRILMLKNHNVSPVDTWLDICSEKNKFRFLGSDLVYNPYVDVRSAISYHMRERYGKNVVWVKEYFVPHLFTYKCHILTDREMWLRKKYQTEVKDVFESDNGIYLYAEEHGKNFEEKKAIVEYLTKAEHADWRMVKAEFAKKYLKDKKSIKEVDEFFKLMEAEGFEEIEEAARK